LVVRRYMPIIYHASSKTRKKGNAQSVSIVIAQPP